MALQVELTSASLNLAHAYEHYRFTRSVRAAIQRVGTIWMRRHSIPAESLNRRGLRSRRLRLISKLRIIQARNGIRMCKNLVRFLYLSTPPLRLCVLCVFS